MVKLYPRREVEKVLNVHYQTIYRMEERGEIDVVRIGKNRMYNLDKYLEENGLKETNKIKICYCRVSSHKQKEDLERQKEYMKENYPTHKIISDIGSGLNYKRDGLKEILELAIKGEIGEIVITYKDRLTRFGYEMIEWLIEKYSGGKIIIINKKEEETPTEEMTKDIISIMNVYVAKINGLRRFKKQIKEEIEKK